MSTECDDILHLRCCICLENTVRLGHQIENQTVNLISSKQTNHFEFSPEEKWALLIFSTFARKNYNVSILPYIFSMLQNLPKTVNANN